MFDWKERVAYCRLAIIANLQGGKHHFDGISTNGLWAAAISARVKLHQEGLLEREGERGLARIRFRLTAAGRSALPQLGGKTRKETIPS